MTSTSPETIEVMECMAAAVRGHGLGLLHALVSTNVSTPDSQSADLCAKLLESGLLRDVSLQPKSSCTEVDNLGNRFVASNISQLFVPQKGSPTPLPEDKYEQGGFPSVPPFEDFLDLPSHVKKEKFFQDVRVGDCVCGRVLSVDEVGITLRLVCTDASFARTLDTFKLDIFIGKEDLKLDSDCQSVMLAYRKRSFVRAVVKDANEDTHRLLLSTIGPNPSCPLPLGVIDEDGLPSYYKATCNLSTSSSFHLFLRRNPHFKNPTLTTFLCNQLHLKDANNLCSFLPELNERSTAASRFGPAEFASDLRAKQSYKLAMKSVIRGVEHYKKGNKTEALQLYNKALQVDNKNVEAFVARGALNVSLDNFEAGILDFESALEANANDLNARKYLIETLTAKAKLQSSKKNKSEAKKCYKRIVQLDASNESARKALGLTQMIYRLSVLLNSSTPVLFSSVESDADKEVIDIETEVVVNGNGKLDPLQHQLQEFCRDSNLPSGEDLAKSITGNDELMGKLKSYYKLYSKSKEDAKSERSKGPEKRRTEDDDIVELSPPPKKTRFSTGSYHRKGPPPKIDSRTPRGRTYIPRNNLSSSAPSKPVRPKVDEEDKKLKKGLNEMDAFIAQLKNKKH